MMVYYFMRIIWSDVLDYGKFTEFDEHIVYQICVRICGMATVKQEDRKVNQEQTLKHKIHQQWRMAKE